MKSENLMIGDWVINPAHNDKCKIHGVYFDKELNCIVATDGRFPQEYFSPIPLTPEILEANGYYVGHTSQEEDLASAIGMPLRGEGKWCYDEGDGEITISLPNESDGGMVTVDNLSDKYMQFLFEETIYVHELQHALRQCGLNELANTLKIK